MLTKTVLWLCSMKHLTVVEPGRFLGIESERLNIQEKGETVAEFPLNRLKSIQILNRGISFSSNLVNQCAMRGIRFFIVDSGGRTVAAVSGIHHHAVVQLRKHQFEFLSTDAARDVARAMITGKLKNQRAVLLYFRKYFEHSNESNRSGLLNQQAELIQKTLTNLKIDKLESADWNTKLMGYEGSAAAGYWQTLKQAGMFASDFTGRTGRGATDCSNQALNLGYSMLLTYVWNALSNAGLEIYAGILHSDRPGKPSLVLDLMEEFRPWVVDRSVIKKRHLLEPGKPLTDRAKRAIIAEVHTTMANKYLYHKKRHRLESILQKQAYRLAGVMSGQKSYRPYLFRW